MVSVAEATSIYSKLANHERITPEERAALDEYARQFKQRESSQNK